MPRIISRTFKDVDALAAVMASQRQETQIDQLSLEPFKARVDRADFGGLLLFFADVDSPVHHTGSRREGFIHFATGLTATHSPSFTHGRRLDADTLFGFDGNRGADTIIQGHALIADVQISQDMLISTCQAMRRDDLNAGFFRHDCVYLPKTLRLYQSYLRELLHLIRSQSPLLYQSDYRQIILGDLIPILIDAIPRQKATLFPPGIPNQRAQIARQARDYIQDNLEQPLTLKDIYTAIKTSRRTLYYSFESTFGMTPIDYLKVQRLQGVRRALKQAEPQAASITKIANQWGFWSLYHFSKAYQSQFGELPSETLKCR